MFVNAIQVEIINTTSKFNRHRIKNKKQMLFGISFRCDILWCMILCVIDTHIKRICLFFNSNIFDFSQAKSIANVRLLVFHWNIRILSEHFWLHFVHAFYKEFSSIFNNIIHLLFGIN